MIWWKLCSVFPRGHMETLLTPSWSWYACFWAAFPTFDNHLSLCLPLWQIVLSLNSFVHGSYCITRWRVSLGFSFLNVFISSFSELPWMCIEMLLVFKSIYYLYFSYILDSFTCKIQVMTWNALLENSVSHFSIAYVSYES